MFVINIDIMAYTHRPALWKKIWIVIESADGVMLIGLLDMKIIVHTIKIIKDLCIMWMYGF